MATAIIRTGIKNEHGLDRYYFQIDMDGKLVLSSKYLGGMVEDFMKDESLATGLVKRLSQRSVTDTEFSLLDGEIIGEDGSLRRVDRLGLLTTTELIEQIHHQYQRGTIIN